MRSDSVEDNAVSDLTRRSFLGAGGVCLSGLAVPACLAAIAGKPIRLSCVLKDADLFTIQFANQSKE